MPAPNTRKFSAASAGSAFNVVIVGRTMSVKTINAELAELAEPGFSAALAGSAFNVVIVGRTMSVKTINAELFELAEPGFSAVSAGSPFNVVDWTAA